MIPESLNCIKIQLSLYEVLYAGDAAVSVHFAVVITNYKL